MSLVQPNFMTWDSHTFNVYRQEDITKFLGILEKEGGRLNSIVTAVWPNGLHSGWDITYSIPSEKDPIEMEVLC